MLTLPVLCGCPPPPSDVLAPLPIRQAIDIVNTNRSQIDAGLQGRGSARGHFVDDKGTRRHFDCRANLLVIPPLHMRLDLQNLGQTQVLFGSNDEVYWAHVKPEIDTYWWGRHASLSDDSERGLSIRPDMLIESLGLNALPEHSAEPDGPFQRIDGDYQQLVFVTRDDEDQGRVSKEYWLSRRRPRLVERILFRDAMGRVVMCSRLSRYRRLGESGPLIAHQVDVDWPRNGGELHLRIRRWEVKTQLTEDHRAFVAPHERDRTFRKMIDIDE